MGKQDVGWLNIPVHDVLLVQEREARQDLSQEVHALAGGGDSTFFQALEGDFHDQDRVGAFVEGDVFDNVFLPQGTN